MAPRDMAGTPVAGPATGSRRGLLDPWTPLEAEPGEPTLSDVLREMRDEARY